MNIKFLLHSLFANQINLIIAQVTLLHKNNAIIFILLEILIIYLLLFLHQKNNKLKNKLRNLEEKFNQQAAILNTQKIELSYQTKEIEYLHKKKEVSNNLVSKLLTTMNFEIIPSLLYMARANNLLLINKHQLSNATIIDTLKAFLQTTNNLYSSSTNIRTCIRNYNKHISYKTSTFSLSLMVDEVINDNKAWQNYNDVMINNCINDNLTISQFRDPLKTIVHQLIINSIKYSIKGNITVTAETADNTSIKIIVQDEGIGITPQKIESILHTNNDNNPCPMYQKNSTGFGYLIINNMLKHLNATIQITSTLGKGARVEICLNATHATQILAD